MEVNIMSERIELKRIHATIPAPLFYELKNIGLLDDFDTMITDFLYDKIEEKRKHGNYGKDKR